MKLRIIKRPDASKCEASLDYNTIDQNDKVIGFGLADHASAVRFVGDFFFFFN